MTEEILSRREYHQHEGPFTKLQKAVWDWFADLIGEAFGDVSSYWMLSLSIIAGLLVLVGVVLLAHLILSERRPRRRGELSLSAAARARANELRLEARAAREVGDLLLALRLSFFALVVGLGERGDLRYRAGWTNRELLERGEPTPEVAEALTPLVGELDAMSFGGARVEDTDVDRFESLCDRWLGGAVQG